MSRLQLILCHGVMRLIRFAALSLPREGASALKFVPGLFSLLTSFIETCFANVISLLLDPIGYSPVKMYNKDN